MGVFSAAAAPPQIELLPHDLRLLDAINAGGAIRGSVAMRRAQLSPEDFLASVKRLSQAQLIDAAGELIDPIIAQYAVLSMKPSSLARFRGGLANQYAANITVKETKEQI